ncbi:transposable element Tcb1 transposase [Trichonephila clavipes]|nr:transposable element Tcb1 transposase [Trichonephila clavipes]
MAGRVPQRKPYISKANKQAWLAFAEMYVRQSTEYWENVIFVDEGKYNIFGSDGKQKVWRKSNTAIHVKNLRRTVKYGGTGSAGGTPGQGCRRATTRNEDRYLVLTARRHQNMNATLLQQHLLGYWHHGFNSDCQKPTTWCWSVCSPTDEDELLAANHPQKLSKNWKELSKQNTQLVINSLIDSMPQSFEVSRPGKIGTAALDETSEETGKYSLIQKCEQGIQGQLRRLNFLHRQSKLRGWMGNKKGIFRETIAIEIANIEQKSGNIQNLDCFKETKAPFSTNFLKEKL